MAYADRRVSLTVKFQSFMVNVHAEISTVAWKIPALGASQWWSTHEVF
jgi:hypothetical protein